ncbi:hypothetical protein BUALT_Bualt18G0080100 [Buddleja alternifolia]|uniref:WPP domain-interacting protein 1 n=1 Tax=Buddleja alternifolia TaxID=168488 RepID=A0AAV6W440_9LAMI|nr:hypothetical protein BUALT_Bualt18G0080100 [Buddleja alternifolia]
MGNNGESKVYNNGSCVVENDDDSYDNELLYDVKGKGAEVSGLVSSVDSLASPSPTMTKKGRGLRKWRRIKRDVRGGDSSDDTRKMLMQDLSNSVANPSKRIQVRAERKQKSGGSVSSTKAMLESLDVFGDSGSAMGQPSFDAGTDSENSEDRSSKSSTAASAPKMNYGMPVVAGFQHDKSIMRSLSGKNSGQRRNGRIDTIKKARGERVKIEKEDSHSSLESDSRSSNFLFMQGTYAISNGIQSDRPIDAYGKNGDEGHGSDRQVSDGLQGGCGRDGERGYDNNSREDVVADSSWEVKEERSQNHDSSTDQDPLVESIFALQSAQEALEKEVLKFKDINIDDDSVSGEGVLTRTMQSAVVETAEGDVETELEALFKQKIETEVEYLAISRTLEKLRATAVDQITLLEEQKAEQTQIINKLDDTESKAAMLKKEVDKLETFNEEIANADQTLKLQKRVCKYTSYLFVQLVCLVLVLGVFIFQLSPNYVEVVPT